MKSPQQAYLKRSTSRRKIAFFWVIPGELPYYFEVSILTLLASNPKYIDVHVIVPKIPSQYDNNTIPSLYFHPVSSTNWRNRVKKKLHLPINYDMLAKGKKLADFKPFLGKLFSDFIPEWKYEWWTYGDSDGIYGSFDLFFNYTSFSKYEIVSGYSKPLGNVNN